MGIESVHPDFLRCMEGWTRVGDVLAGRDAVMTRGEPYLPMLESHRSNSSDYAEYAGRGLWYGATGRTHDGFLGAIYRREPTLRLTRRTERMKNNATGTGDSFYTFSKFATGQVIGKGRYGLFLDRPLDGGDPYIVGYEAEEIRNWRMRRVNGQLQLDQVILHEFDDVPADDGFGSKIISRYRVLELDSDGYFQVRIFSRVEGGGVSRTEGSGSYVETERFVPRPTGKPIEYIPFVFIGPTHLRPTPSKPPLLDMADVNLVHWRNSCDHQMALHRIAFPQIVFTGVDDVGNTAWINDAKRIWGLPMGATFGMLEFKGDGLGAIERDLDRCEAYMARLGARMLEDQKRVVETAEALSIRASGETSTLANIARTVGDGFQILFRWAAEWESEDASKVTVELNQDFHDGRMSPQDLLSLVTTYQQGVLPLEDFLWNLQRGEVLKPGRTLEEAQTLLESNPPILLGQSVSLDEPSPGQVAQTPRPQSAPGGIQTATKAPRNGRSQV